MPLYEEKLNVNYPFIGGIFLFALAVDQIPSIILGGLWWLTVLYLVLIVGSIVSFFRGLLSFHPEHQKVFALLLNQYYRKSQRVKKEEMR